jgi:glycolate oxidase iron-sulfur subunit
MTDLASDLASALAAQEERLSHCVHCGFCLPVCPTYVRLRDENDSPRGRLHLMRAVAGGRLSPGAESFTLHIDRCLGCRACETVCPSGVEYGFLLERARDSIAAETGRPLTTRVLLSVFSSPGLRGISMGLARLLRSTGLPSLLSRMLPDRGWARGPRLGLAMLAATRAPELATGVGGGDGRESAPGDEGLPLAPRGRVGVLTGCVQDGLLRRVNEATERVLAANGWEVVPVPGQGCCGALHAHAGDLAGARRLARQNLDAFGGLDLDHVVVNAAGCGATMKEYHELTAGDSGSSEGGEAFVARVRDVNEFLFRTGVRKGAPIPERVTVDRPCHLVHAQGIRSEPEDLLREAIPDLEVLPLRDADECCGGAGIYGITHPELGGSIGEDKIEAILDTGAGMALSPNPGCMMQIGAGLLLRGASTGTLHPIELLDESYRRAGFYES